MISNYGDLTTKEIELLDKEQTVVMLPLGATEQHGPQAPLGTDALIAQTLPTYIVSELKKQAPDYNLLVFDALPVGLNIEHSDFPGTVSFSPLTYYHVLEDIIRSLSSHGFRKFAMLLCHGGNRATVDILACQLRQELSVYLFALNAGAFLDPEVQATISHGNDWDFHGGEMETSMVLAIKPETVKMQYAQTGFKKGGYAKDGAINFSNEAALNWVGCDLQTAEGTPLGIGGNPLGATAQKGELILQRSAQALIPALLEIRNWKLE